MKTRYSTHEVAKLLNIEPYFANRLIERGNIMKPEKVGRAFVWTLADINRASEFVYGHKFQSDTSETVTIKKQPLSKFYDSIGATA